MSALSRKFKNTLAGLLPGVLALTVSLEAAAAKQQLELDKDCIVNVLNRTIAPNEKGRFELNNIPSSMGQIRARATCTKLDAQEQPYTITGQTDYFTVPTNGKVDVGIFYTGVDDFSNAPVEIYFTQSGTLTLNAIDATADLRVMGAWANGNVKNITAASSGINYNSSNADIVEVTGFGRVTAKAPGSALITARKDGVVTVLPVSVVTSVDTDGDGIPDHVEIEKGLDPNDYADGYEDLDGDGISSRDEFALGTDMANPDSDGDGLSDGEEITYGADGYVTDPLDADSDDDGISDGLEASVNSDPNDPDSMNLDSLLVGLTATPENGVLYYNTIESESSLQLTVTGTLVDGNQIDLTSTARGTRYLSDDLTIANFGATPGEIFAGQQGVTYIQISNAGFTTSVQISVFTYEPQVITYFDLGVNANNVDLGGNLAYVATNNGLVIVDISNPANPQWVGSLYGAKAYDVKYQDGYAYLATDNGVEVVDVRIAIAPLNLSTLPTGGAAYDVAFHENTMAVATAGGMVLYDVTSAGAPSYQSQINSIGSVQAVDLDGTLIAAVGSDNQVHGISYQDPLFPVLESSLLVSGAREVAVKESVAFLAAYSQNRYAQVDFTDITQPELQLSGREFYPNDVVIVGDYAIYSEVLFKSGMAIVNAQNVQNPVYSAKIDMYPRYGDWDCDGAAANEVYALCTSANRLYINQYRMLVDNAGVAPTITILSPTEGSTIEQGRTYRFAADVVDDVQVAVVNFIINDEIIYSDTTAPYTVSFAVPRDATGINIDVEAADIANNRTRVGYYTDVQPLTATEETLVNESIAAQTNLLYHSLVLENTQIVSGYGLETNSDLMIQGAGASRLTVRELTVNGDLIIDGTELILKTRESVDVLGNVEIINGGKLTVARPAQGELYYPLVLNVDGEVLVDSDSTIDAVGAGFTATTTQAYVAPANTAVAVTDNRTGAHAGGRYNVTDGTSVGRYVRAETAGNGGDYYNANITGFGGGFVEINAATLTLQGAILANGDAGDDVGGAGGGIHLNVETLVGNGLLEASGGMGRTIDDLAGSGGRISIYTADDSEFDGNIFAFAGYNYQGNNAAAGTVYVKRTDENRGHLTIDNGGRITATTPTPLSAIGVQEIQSVTLNADGDWVITAVDATPWVDASSNTLNLAGLSVSLDATDANADSYPVLANTANTLTINTNGLDISDIAGNQLQGVIAVETLNVKGGATADEATNRLDVRDELGSVTEDPLTTEYSELLFGELTIRSLTMTVFRDYSIHAVRDVVLNSASMTVINVNLQPYPLDLVVGRQLLVDAGSTINVNGNGYGAESDNSHVWPDNSVVTYTYGRSGCHGGERRSSFARNDLESCEYGQYEHARFAGSAGRSSGIGGGIVSINASQFHLDGLIKADGLYDHYLGGAGGSIHIETTLFSGTGSLSVNGGNNGNTSNAYNRGAAGGGRISLYADDLSGFTGSYSARGGNNNGVAGHAGGAGTIYVKNNTEQYGSLTIDNAGNPAPENSTRLRSVGLRTITATEDMGNGQWKITIDEAAWTVMDQSLDQGLEGLFVDLDASDETGPLYRIVDNGEDFIVVTVDSNQVTPDDLGVAAGYQLIGVHTFKALTVAGGASLFVGTDRVQLLDATDLSFTNAQMRFGQMNFPGSLSLQDSQLQIEQFTVNGDLSLDKASITLMSNHVIDVQGDIMLDNHSLLTIAESSGVMDVSISAAGGIYIDSDSGIDVSGKGYSANRDVSYVWPNNSTVQMGKGRSGCHGGERRDSFNNDQAGCGYGRYDHARFAGSGGDELGADEGSGGGVVSIFATALMLDGYIKANGLYSTYMGGAGGSIHIETSLFSGTGSLSANGGNNGNTSNAYNRGTGGGGRISLYADDLSGFTGSYSARGGNNNGVAGHAGGAGTIYVKNNTEQYGSLTIDNAGNPAPENSTRLRSVGLRTITATEDMGNGQWKITIDEAAWTVMDQSLDQGLEGLFVDLDASDETGPLYRIVDNAEDWIVVTVDSNQATPDDLGVAAGYQLIGVHTLKALTVAGGAKLYLGSDRLVLEQTDMFVLDQGSGMSTGPVVLPVDVKIDGGTWSIESAANSNGFEHIQGDLTVLNGGLITTPRASDIPVSKVSLVVGGVVTIDSASSIDVSGRGYYSSGRDYGHVWPDNSLASSRGSGRSGCHAGVRYDTGTDENNCGYGRFERARFAGSAGGFYADSSYAVSETGGGGGIIEISTPSLLLNGKLLADGRKGAYNAGAGGSIHLDVGTLSGTGQLSVNGDYGSFSGHIASGAGRISSYVDDDSAFTGSYSAQGGYDSYYQLIGGAGTIYIKRNGEQYGHLRVDNGGHEQPVATQIRSVGLRNISAVEELTDGTWKISIDEAIWEPMDQALAQGLDGLLVDLDASTEDGPLYQIVDNGSDWIQVTVEANQPTPLELGVDTGDQLVGVHAFESLLVEGGARVNMGEDRVFLKQVESFTVDPNSNVTGGPGVVEGNVLVDGGTWELQNAADSNGVVHIKGNLDIINGGVVTAVSSSTSGVQKVSLVVDGEITIDASSAINGDGKGYQSNTQHYSYVWPNNQSVADGTGRSGCHGGGRSNSPGCGYGRYEKARFAGSGGSRYSDAQPGHGGGVVEITSSVLNLEGSISANGLTGWYIGGAGGSVHLDVQTLTGSGSVSARGDSGLYGDKASGGGRISVYVNDDTGFTGSYDAKGGYVDGPYSPSTGGAGTIYIKRSAEQYGHLAVDNGGHTAPEGSTRLRSVNLRNIVSTDDLADGTWKITVDEATWPSMNQTLDQGLDGLLVDLDASTEDGPLYRIVDNGADWIVIAIEAGQATPGEMGVIAGNQLVGVHVFETLTVTNGAQLSSGEDRVVLNQNLPFTVSGTSVITSGTGTIEGDVSVSGGKWELLNAADSNGVVHIKGNLDIINGGVVTAVSSSTSGVQKVSLVVDGEITIDASSAINGDGKGYQSNTQHYSYVWPNNQSVADGTGRSGCHGGGRSNSPGCGYGRYEKARFAGSGGSRYSDAQPGHGGGVVEITSSVLNLEGSISANGLTGWYIGGAGGSVHLDVQTLTGSGSVSARGDSGLYGDKASGGGRISVYVNDDTGFTGSYDAKGGYVDGPYSPSTGGAGTIYIKRSAEQYGHLAVDNGGHTAPEGSTRLRSVNLRNIVSTDDLADGTWKITVDEATWPSMNQTLDQGLDGLLVDLDASTEDGPLYRIVDNGADWIVIAIEAGQATPGEMGVIAGNQLVGVHVFETLTVTNGAQLSTGDDVVKQIGL